MLLIETPSLWKIENFILEVDEFAIEELIPNRMESYLARVLIISSPLLSYPFTNHDATNLLTI